MFRKGRPWVIRPPFTISRLFFSPFNPIVVIETVEEDRIETMLEALAPDLGLTFFDWSVVKGLRRSGTRAAFHGTNKPLTALQYISGLTVDGIYLLRDFGPYMESNEVSSAVQRAVSTPCSPEFKRYHYRQSGQSPGRTVTVGCSLSAENFLTPVNSKVLFVRY